MGLRRLERVLAIGTRIALSSPEYFNVFTTGQILEPAPEPESHRAFCLVAGGDWRAVGRPRPRFLRGAIVPGPLVHAGPAAVHRPGGLGILSSASAVGGRTAGAQLGRRAQLAEHAGAVFHHAANRPLGVPGATERGAHRPGLHRRFRRGVHPATGGGIDWHHGRRRHHRPRGRRQARHPRMGPGGLVPGFPAGSAPRGLPAFSKGVRADDHADPVPAGADAGTQPARRPDAVGSLAGTAAHLPLESRPHGAVL